MQDANAASPPQPSALDRLGDAIRQALAEAPVADVLSLLTGAFVGLTLEVIRREGHDADREIKVDGGPNRDITIHAPKSPAGQRG